MHCTGSIRDRRSTDKSAGLCVLRRVGGPDNPLKFIRASWREPPETPLPHYHNGQIVAEPQQAQGRYMQRPSIRLVAGTDTNPLHLPMLSDLDNQAAGGGRGKNGVKYPAKEGCTACPHSKRARQQHGTIKKSIAGARIIGGKGGEKLSLN